MHLLAWRLSIYVKRTNICICNFLLFFLYSMMKCQHDETTQMGIDNINALLDSFMGINDSELAEQVTNTNKWWWKQIISDLLPIQSYLNSVEIPKNSKQIEIIFQNIKILDEKKVDSRGGEILQKDFQSRNFNAKIYVGWICFNSLGESTHVRDSVWNRCSKFLGDLKR